MMPIDDLKLAAPCCESWDEMRGDNRRRHCEVCDKDVVNLSAMTEEETRRFLSRVDNACIRYVYDDADTVVFVHPQVRRQRRGLKRLIGASALVPLLLGTTACDLATDDAAPKAVAVEATHDISAPIVNASGMARLNIDDAMDDAPQCHDEEDTDADAEDFDAPPTHTQEVEPVAPSSKFIVGIW